MQLITELSWHHIKSINDDIQTWGMKKKDKLKRFKIMFESLLRRCGRYLQHVDLECFKVNDQIVDIVKRECCNVQQINMGYQAVTSKNEIEMIKPIFKYFKKFELTLGNSDIDNEDLKNLLSLNEKLEHFDISDEGRITLNVLDALPSETIKELHISLKSTSIQSICYVSTYSFLLLFF